MYHESIHQLIKWEFLSCLSLYPYFIFCHFQLCHLNNICHLIYNLNKQVFRLFNLKFLVKKFRLDNSEKIVFWGKYRPGEKQIGGKSNSDSFASIWPIQRMHQPINLQVTQAKEASITLFIWKKQKQKQKYKMLIIIIIQQDEYLLYTNS